MRRERIPGFLRQPWQTPVVVALVALSLVLLPGVADAQRRGKRGKRVEVPEWLPQAMPLPLKVETPEDLSFKAAAERIYLILNLFTAGKLAWDAGDFTQAAEKWEALLRTPNLPADVLAVTKPLAEEARKRAGGKAASVPAVPLAVAAPVLAPAAGAATAAPAKAKKAKKAKAKKKKQRVSVRGRVSGGGELGPGGTVIWLKPTSGRAPKPRPAKNRRVVQRDKRFIPRVLAVPVGTTVEFRNEDGVYHNVFSLTPGHKFDLGLYEAGASRGQAFTRTGPAQVLCNIHSSMIGYVFTVDTPWYGQAKSDGSFLIKGVPPGQYVVSAWHELSSAPSEQVMEIGDEGAQLTISVTADKRPQTIVPDKYGKPRQPQLGY